MSLACSIWIFVLLLLVLSFNKKLDRPEVAVMKEKEG
jgi:hypothetical protein